MNPGGATTQPQPVGYVAGRLYRPDTVHEEMALSSPRRDRDVAQQDADELNRRGFSDAFPSGVYRVFALVPVEDELGVREER